MRNWKPKEDSISRAGWLVNQGYVQPGEGADVLQCWSQTHGEEKIYTVTYDSCECYVGQYRKSIICKHRWAAFASPAVCLILEIRQAISKRDLESIGRSYAEAMTTTDELFVKKARLEYVKRAEELERLTKGMAA